MFYTISIISVTIDPISYVFLFSFDPLFYQNKLLYFFYRYIIFLIDSFN
jgi:hypothetical protein